MLVNKRTVLVICVNTAGEYFGNFVVQWVKKVSKNIIHEENA